ncbi:MAG: hypothetical protein ABEH43_01110, partial [Flavobacteriales bacterium]
VKEVDVKVETNDVLKMTGPTTKQIHFNKPSDKITMFNIKAKKKIGIGKIKVKASSGNKTAKYEIELNVNNPNPKIVETQ